MRLAVGEAITVSNKALLKTGAVNPRDEQLTHDAVCAIGGSCAGGGAVVICPAPTATCSVEAGHWWKAGADICRRVWGVALQRYNSLDWHIINALLFADHSLLLGWKILGWFTASHLLTIIKVSFIVKSFWKSNRLCSCLLLIKSPLQGFKFYTFQSPLKHSFSVANHVLAQEDTHVSLQWLNISITE